MQRSPILGYRRLSRGYLPTICILASVVSVLAIVSYGETEAKDVISLPPKERVVCSADGTRCVRVVRPEKLSEEEAPKMYVGQPDRWDQRDAEKLEYLDGPRFIFVLNNGFIIFVDQWQPDDNPTRAIQVYDKDGSRVATFAGKTIKNIANVTEESIEKHAGRTGFEFGLWLSGRPKLDQDAQQLAFEIGKKTVTLDMAMPKNPSLYVTDQRTSKQGPLSRMLTVFSSLLQRFMLEWGVIEGHG